MKKNKRLLTVLGFALICLSCFAFGCEKDVESGSDLPPITEVEIELEERSITLEKYEEYSLGIVSTLSADKITWRTDDSTVASVQNGKVVAVSEGKTIVRASYGEVEAKCLVEVTDNGYTLAVSTNFDDSDVNLLLNDQTAVEAFANYNGSVKADAQIEYKVVGDNSIVSFTGNTLKANAIGSTQVEVKATWKGLTAIAVYEVNVVSDLSATLAKTSSVNLYLSNYFGDTTSYIVDPIVFEGGKKLSQSEYEITYLEYNQDVIGFSSNIITAKSLGKVDLTAKVKSLNTNTEITVILPIEVGLVERDLTSADKTTIELTQDYYSVEIDKIFADINAAELEDCQITNVYDVTVGKVAIEIEDGRIATAQLEELKLITETEFYANRIWRIECEKFAYLVRIEIARVDYYKQIAGQYIAKNWDPHFQFNEDGTFIMDIENRFGIKTSGRYILTPYSMRTGMIYLRLEKSYATFWTFEGNYSIGDGGIWHLNINIAPAFARYDWFVYFSPMGVTGSGCPYLSISGNYTVDGNTALTMNLKENGEFALKNGSQVTNGNYILCEDGTVDFVYGDGKVISGKWAFKYNGRYDITAEVDGTAIVFNQKAEGWRHTLPGRYLDMDTGIYIVINTDGTMIFDTSNHVNACQLGFWEINEDVEFVITLEEGYRGNKTLTGKFAKDKNSDWIYIITIKIRSSHETITLTRNQAF